MASGATRIAISTVACVCILVPVIATLLHFQMKLAGESPLGYVPVPSLRINLALVTATIADLIFLAMAWEFLGKAYYLNIMAGTFVSRFTHGICPECAQKLYPEFAGDLPDSR